MTLLRGLAWLAAAALFVEGCDRTLTFEPAEGSAGTDDAGKGGVAGSGGTGGSGGSGGKDGLISSGGTFPDREPHHDGGASSTDDECREFCGDLGLRCLEVWQTCVECLEHDDCYYKDLVCDRELNRCVPCVANKGCDRGDVCDGWSRQCVESCATEANPDRDCRDDGVCDEDRNICVVCWDDEDCRDSSDGPLCLPGGARCGECVVDGDCRFEAPYCDPVRHDCVACRDSRDCPEPSICHPEAHACMDPRLPWTLPPAPH
jgi:hypothetical protein